LAQVGVYASLIHVSDSEKTSERPAMEAQNASAYRTDEWINQVDCQQTDPELWKTNISHVQSEVGTLHAFGGSGSSTVRSDQRDPLLRDVPEAQLQRVADALAELHRAAGGSLEAEMRDRLVILGRLALHSREVVLRFCGAMTSRLRTGCEERGSRQKLQQAFHRLGGPRKVTEALLARAGDVAIVRTALQTLSASVEANPIAAETMRLNDTRDIRLLMKLLLRHATDTQVAEHGSGLIAHLCALPPRLFPSALNLGMRDPGMVAIPRAYRDNQTMLVEEEGACDFLVTCLGRCVRSIKEIDLRVQSQKADVAYIMEQTEEAMEPTDDGYVSPEMAKAKVKRTKASIELREGWTELIDAEAAAARTQEQALQALVLLACGNEVAVRSICASLWRWANPEPQPEPETKMSKFFKTKPKLNLSQQGSAKTSGRSDPDNTSELPIGESKGVLSTLEAFRQTCSLLTDVLIGRASVDRGSVAEKACRLLTLLAEQRQAVAARISVGQNRLTLDLRLRCRSLPPDNVRPSEPFAALEPVVAAVTMTLRRHKDYAPVAAAGIIALKELREVALLSAPPGVEAGGAGMRSAWQSLLTKAEEEEELVAVQDLLHCVLETTDKANITMGNLGLTAESLTGESMWVTPRMRAQVARALPLATQLASETVVSKERTRELARLGADASQELAAMKSSKASSFKNRSGKSTARSTLAPVPREDSDAKSGIAPDQALDLTNVQESTSIPLPSTPRIKFNGALGYGQANFERVWKEPIADVLTRSLSVPAITPSKVQAARTDDGALVDGALTAPLDVDLVEMGPGLLKARCVVPSADVFHQKFLERRLKELLEPGAASTRVGAQLSKDMRKAGYLLPTRGLKVSVKKIRRPAEQSSSCAQLLRLPAVG